MRDDRLKVFAKEMRTRSTRSESWMWKNVRDRRLGGYKFRRQAVLDPYIVDFICEEAKLVVELDGASHDGREEYDLARKRFLESKGYLVLRIGTDLKFSDGSEVLPLILAECQKRAPWARPSPEGDE